MATRLEQRLVHMAKTRPDARALFHHIASSKRVRRQPSIQSLVKILQGRDPRITDKNLREVITDLEREGDPPLVCYMGQSVRFSNQFIELACSVMRAL